MKISKKANVVIYNSLYAVIFRHNGTEKIRFFHYTKFPSASEEVAAVRLKEQFNIEPDEIIQITCIY